MKTVKLSPTWWDVYDGDVAIAQIHLDYSGQVDVLILRTEDPKKQLACKRLAASHMAQYVRHRTSSALGGLATITHHPTTTRDADSDKFMDFSLIPERIARLEEKQLDEGLIPHVQVIVGKYASFRVLLDAAMLTMKREHGVSVRCHVVPWKDWPERLTIWFSVRGTERFRFWKSVFKKRDIIPPYHPVMKDGKEVGLVNGDTDAYIGQSEIGISSIHCPPEARATTERNVFSSSWTKVKHPFRAEGRSFSIEMSAITCVSEETFHVLIELLRAALGQEDMYIAISGGFRTETGSYEDAHVWEYQTLKEEGLLDQSSIPERFKAQHLHGPGFLIQATPGGFRGF